MISEKIGECFSFYVFKCRSINDCLVIIPLSLHEKPLTEPDLNSQLSYNKRTKLNHIKFLTISEPYSKEQK